MKAIILGATGLVGSELTKLLKESNYYHQVMAYGRRTEAIDHLSSDIITIEKLNEVEEIDLSEIDHVYCCIGTTIKKAKSKEKFSEVDLDIPLRLAKICQNSSVKKLIVVSALGADSNSKVFYNHTKGKMEEGVKEIFPASTFVRPSLLLGERDEQRIAEGIGQYLMPLLNPLLQGNLKKFRAIEAKDVARALFEIASFGKTNIEIEYRQ
jgi:uncharacterized protein YbjT (DUF2867 family)